MKNKPASLSKPAELRQQAEQKWRNNRQNTGPIPAVESDIRKLVHELQIRQIELEMQNEELIQARAESEAALHQYTELYDFAPVGYLSLTREGRINKVNLAGANLLGVARSKLLNQYIHNFISSPSQKLFSTFFKNVFATGGSRETCEVSILKGGANPIWVQIDATTSASLAGQDEQCNAILVDITASKEAEAQLRHLSIHDGLTDLYNRSYFEEELARLERGRDFPISILMVDVDDLKKINDKQGHSAGDDLLKRVAQILIEAFRAEDIIARIGGDEFAVLLPATNAAAAEVLLQRVRQVIIHHNPSQLGTPVSISLGVSTADTSATQLLDVLKEADANMYREKRGRDGD